MGGPGGGGPAPAEQWPQSPRAAPQSYVLRSQLPAGREGGAAAGQGLRFGSWGPAGGQRTGVFLHSTGAPPENSGAQRHTRHDVTHIHAAAPVAQIAGRCRALQRRSSRGRAHPRVSHSLACQTLTADTDTAQTCWKHVKPRPPASREIRPARATGACVIQTCEARPCTHAGRHTMTQTHGANTRHELATPHSRGRTMLQTVSCRHVSGVAHGVTCGCSQGHAVDVTDALPACCSQTQGDTLGIPSAVSVAVTASDPTLASCAHPCSTYSTMRPPLHAALVKLLHRGREKMGSESREDCIGQGLTGCGPSWAPALLSLQLPHQ